MAKFRTVVAATDTEIEGGEHLSKVIDVANFAAVLSNAEVTAAVTDARTVHPGETVFVKSYLPHAANGPDDGAEHRAGARYYVPSAIEFYTDTGEKISSISPVVTFGQSKVAAVYGDYSKIYFTTPAIRAGHSQTVTGSTNVTGGFSFTLASDATLISVPVHEGTNSPRHEIEAREIEVEVGAAGRAVNTRVQGRIRLVGTQTTIASTTTAPSYQYYASGNVDLTVDFTIQAA